MHLAFASGFVAPLLKGEMSTVAEELRTAREAQGLTVYQVAEITKIKTDHVRALDAGDYDVFVAPVYVRGFVRTYAATLRLDGKKHSEHPPLTDRRGGILDWISYQLSRVDWKFWFPILILLVTGALAVWIYRAVRARESEDPLKRLSPGMHQPAKSPGRDTLPLPNQPNRR
jgi:cytoskeletal protein RodZ